MPMRINSGLIRRRIIGLRHDGRGLGGDVSGRQGCLQRGQIEGAAGSSIRIYPELHDGPGVGADADLGLGGAARRG